MDDDQIDKIFVGDLDNLARLSSKVVRIFTSSTYTDMLLERNTLAQFVYPKLKNYCRERHGVEFQAWQAGNSIRGKGAGRQEF